MEPASGGGGEEVVCGFSAKNTFKDMLLRRLTRNDSENRSLKSSVQALQESLNNKTNCIQYLDSRTNSLINTKKLTLTSEQIENDGGNDARGGGGSQTETVEVYTLEAIPSDMFVELSENYF